MRFAYALAVCAFTATASFAQYGNLTETFFGPSQQAVFPSAVTSAAPVSIGSGVTNVVTPNMINASNWTTNNAPDFGTDYYAFSFLTNQEISVPSVTVNALASNQGPTMIDIRSSLDGFSTTLDTEAITPGSITSLTFTLPAASFGNIPAGTNLEIRLYGYLAANSGTNSQLGFISPNGSTAGVSVPISAPLPEPLSLLGIATLGLAGCGFMRRKMKAR